MAIPTKAMSDSAERGRLMIGNYPRYVQLRWPRALGPPQINGQETVITTNQPIQIAEAYLQAGNIC